MNNKQAYLQAIDELWMIKNINIPTHKPLIGTNNPKIKISKLGIFIYDNKAEVKIFDRTSVNPLGVIINKKM